MLLNSYMSENIEKYGTGFKRIKDWFKNYSNLNYQVKNMQDFVQVTIESVSKKLNDELNKGQKAVYMSHLTNRITCWYTNNYVFY